MAFHPTQNTTFKNGTTPATGTLALGSIFQAEFVQLYENDNFLKTYFPTDDRLTIDEMEAKSGSYINILDSVGFNIASPITQLQIHELTSGSSLIHFSNTTTGALANHGLDIGIDASEQGRIWNYENTDLIIGTNNTAIAYVKSNGLAIGTTAVKGANGVVHIADGVNADTNWQANSQVIVESDDYAYINIRTPNNRAGGIIASDPDAAIAGFIGYNHGSLGWQFKVENNNIMFLNSTGLYVGGIAAPSNSLHVQSTTTPQMRVAFDSSNYGTISCDSGGDVTIACGATLGRIYLTPGAGDAVVDLSSGTELIFRSSGGSGKIYHDITDLRLTAATGNIRIEDYLGIGLSPSSYQLELSTDSAGKPSTNTWTIVSDKRLKKDIKEFKDGLDIILGLNPKMFKYNGKGGMPDNNKDNIGFIAQNEIDKVPYMFDKFMHKLNKDDKEEIELLNYNGHALPFILVNAIKEQQQIINNLINRIQKLEN